jgi:hypothetical protein
MQRRRIPGQAAAPPDVDAMPDFAVLPRCRWQPAKRVCRFGHHLDPSWNRATGIPTPCAFPVYGRTADTSPGAGQIPGNARGDVFTVESAVFLTEGMRGSVSIRSVQPRSRNTQPTTSRAPATTLSTVEARIETGISHACSMRAPSSKPSTKRASRLDWRRTRPPARSKAGRRRCAPRARRTSP